MVQRRVQRGLRARCSKCRSRQDKTTKEPARAINGEGDRMSVGQRLLCILPASSLLNSACCLLSLEELVRLHGTVHVARTYNGKAQSLLVVEKKEQEGDENKRAKLCAGELHRDRER